MKQAINGHGYLIHEFGNLVMRCTNPNCNEAVCMYCNVGSNDTSTQKLIGPDHGSIYKYAVRTDM
jgi:hypothetical protein